MSLETLIQLVINGLLMGFIFSLLAEGLTLIYGVMDIVNFAHGEYLMLGMFTAYWLNVYLGLDPLLSLPICAVVLFVIGMGTYKGIISRILFAPMLCQIFATFGLMILLRNVALFLWGPDYRLISEPIVDGRIEVSGVFLSVPKFVACIGSIITTGILYLFLAQTKTGRALQATAIDREAAALMGINTERMHTLAFGIGAACAGVAGALLSNFYYIFPEVGDNFVLLAFVTVALGGFGSIQGTFVAGIIIGLVESLSGFFIAPSLKYACVFLIYLGVVLVRPKGLFGW